MSENGVSPAKLKIFHRNGCIVPSIVSDYWPLDDPRGAFQKYRSTPDTIRRPVRNSKYLVILGFKPTRHSPHGQICPRINGAGVGSASGEKTGNGAFFFEERFSGALLSSCASRALD